MKRIDRRRIAVMNHHYRYCSVEDFFSSLERSGICSVDLWSCAHHFFIDYREHQDTAAMLRKAAFYGLDIVCFTPEQSCPRPYNMAAADPELRRKTAGYYENAVECAAQFGGRLQVTAGWHCLGQPYGDAWLRSREMLTHIADRARREGVRVELEAVSSPGPQLVNSLAAVARMLREVDSPALFAVADTTNVESNGDTLASYFQTLGSRVDHVHLVDGTPDGHLAWGDGTRDLTAVLQTLEEFGYTGYLTLETVGPASYEADPAGADRRSLERLAPYLERSPRRDLPADWSGKEGERCVK